MFSNATVDYDRSGGSDWRVLALARKKQKHVLLQRTSVKSKRNLRNQLERVGSLITEGK